MVVGAGRVLHWQQEAVAALSMIAWLASRQERNSKISVEQGQEVFVSPTPHGKAMPPCSALTSTLPVPLSHHTPELGDLMSPLSLLYW